LAHEKYIHKNVKETSYKPHGPQHCKLHKTLKTFSLDPLIVLLTEFVTIYLL